MAIPAITCEELIAYYKYYYLGYALKGLAVCQSYVRYKEYPDYYHCTESYLREEKLTETFIRLLESVGIEETESKEALQTELDRFRRLSAVLLAENGSDEQDINLHTFAKYITRQGIRDQQRELIACLKQTIYLKDKTITTRV